MARRSKAREVCLQMLFQADVNPDIDAQTVQSMIHEQLSDEALSLFAWQLYSGVMEIRSLLDTRIQNVAENWSLSRMAPTDRNVLRLGAFELLQTETPLRVVLDEAIDLARKFGTAQSPRFVNGILDKLVPVENKERDASDTPSEEF